MASASMLSSAISASAILASRADAPTRKLPVISLSKASRAEALDASSQPATIEGNSAFGVVRSVSTTSCKAGVAWLVGRSGHISATVSARSPT
jgi:hypothetical protein